ncbi:MAG: L,D-transpeptidase family protein [Burkholderiales bacterium]
MKKRLFLFLIAFPFCAGASAAPTETVPELSHAIVGERFEYAVRPGDFLIGLAARFGESALIIAENNGIAYNKPLFPGQRLEIDNRHVVPPTAENGILINLPQRMLFFFRNGVPAGAYPTGLGMPGWPTPEGSFSVVQLRRNPAWYVPLSIQEEMRRKGETVLTKVSPGPDNPLGKYWIGLSIPGYGIHGTNAPASVYHFQSHGCIRLQPENIEKLFPQIAIGDTGKIVYAPLLLALLNDGSIYLEVDRDIYGKGGDMMPLLKQLADANRLTNRIDWEKAGQAVERQSGLATRIDLQPGAM